MEVATYIIAAICIIVCLLMPRIQQKLKLEEMDDIVLIKIDDHARYHRNDEEDEVV